jgi:hypothetical protein
VKVSEDSLPRTHVHPRLWYESLVAELARGPRSPRVHAVRGGLLR